MFFGLLFTRPGGQPRHATEASTYPSKPVAPIYMGRKQGHNQHQNRSNVNPRGKKDSLPEVQPALRAGFSPEAILPLFEKPRLALSPFDR